MLSPAPAGLPLVGIWMARPDRRADLGLASENFGTVGARALGEGGTGVSSSPEGISKAMSRGEHVIVTIFD